MASAEDGPGLRIGGEVRAPGVLRMADLRDLPQRTAEVVFSCGSKGIRRHTFTGPLLRDVVAAADPEPAHGDRMNRLRFRLVLEAVDGHRVVLSWGELDPDFGAAPLLLAVSRDGASLDAEGPQLAVPGDRCGARSLGRVAAVTVRSDGRPARR
ncbi:molybdopterin-dependent oxidoreductase-like protein [Actinocorallia herbida]|uniref:Molybdopterin-dependent oxidoreductase-like protein n=1 Tax=Actinocorallia herbida TaxID=58109 RepID=A0A3N1CYH3_9ACTN|nr:molybdopterin-dependent oxidoreductase [Actinocorallia herbida]ROO86332.1 molybdopterin-dependent oxidoreductase-like protein [Actinocorallia herbida]